MTAPDDPYASPRDREAPGAGPALPPHGQIPRVAPPPPGQPVWGAPSGPPGGDALPPPPGPPSGAGGLGVAALVAGLLALLLGVTMVGGLLFGALALLLGTRGRARARLRGGGAGTAVAGLVLGTLGLALAAGTYAYVRDDLAEYQGCRRESVSLAQDRACERALRASIEGRS